MNALVPAATRASASDVGDTLAGQLQHYCSSVSRGDAETRRGPGRRLRLDTIAERLAQAFVTRGCFLHTATKMHALDDITGAVVDSSIRIHRGLGPGLLEAVYEAVLARALERRGFTVERQRAVRFEYDGMIFEEGLRVDLLVDGRVILELKSQEKLAPVHRKQLLTYLRLMRLPVGLLINFGAGTLIEGLHRIVNDLPPSASPRLRVNRQSQQRPGRDGD